MDPHLISKLKVSYVEADRIQGIALLKSHLENHPDDISSLYDVACCHDFLGEEQAAEPFYQRVYDLGPELLPESQRAGFYVGFGSTLRNNKKFLLSKKVLEKGVHKYPQHRALIVFLALTFYSNNQPQEAAKTLFGLMASLPEGLLEGYEHAIKAYCDVINSASES